ncbi:MAG TPA: hypothetical protein DEB17_00485 [Chlorobaculum sp.]|uniref:Uncharacterized protein n=1 Tax=Chlorobaculum tepidum (strain ATCC 49652 / DSM 12025 / NBRC 103806 / TLS) TaxID=194439 RepID=Q8KC07_CHLTE|nr:hypothetical protein CT1623 [Chlorobaculum tepidum TLS]HBU22476.1 hypothetical protein [Chlorobaculum sp.]
MLMADRFGWTTPGKNHPVCPSMKSFAPIDHHPALAP